MRFLGLFYDYIRDIMHIQSILQIAQPDTQARASTKRILHSAWFGCGTYFLEDLVTRNFLEDLWSPRGLHHYFSANRTGRLKENVFMQPTKSKLKTKAIFKDFNAKKIKTQLLTCYRPL